MSSRANYWLKVTGTLEGELSGAELKEVTEAFQNVFPSEPPEKPAPLGDWPVGFCFPDGPDGYRWPTYRVYIWDSSVETLPFRTVRRARPLTLLNFHAELGCVRPLSLYQNYEDMKREVEWFYSYCRQNWYLDMMRKIEQLNGRLFEMGKLRDWVDVRDWCWGCGNGGGE
jgi:hypothetical protein